MRLGVNLAALLLLAACGEGAPESRLDESQQRLMAMNEGDRGGVLAQAIRTARRRCEQVVASSAIEPPGLIPTYVAQCDNGDRFVVFIRRDGKTDVQLTAGGNVR